MNDILGCGRLCGAQLPAENSATQGLYSQEYEHDSCGIGFVADIKGKKSHKIISCALEVLERMTHRGAESADNKTGDGSGILIQIPHTFYKKLIPSLPEAGEYGTGLVFLPQDAGEQKKIITKIEMLAAEMELRILSIIDIPVDSSCIGKIAMDSEPVIKQIFVANLAQGGTENKNTVDPLVESAISELDLKLFILRKKIEKYVRAELGIAGFAIPSLSSATIVYKGMLMPEQLRKYFLQLDEEGMESAVALVHSRFSTNTFPAWDLAQPFRAIAHNGEINTVKGNRFWAAARESLYQSPRLGKYLADILPVIEEGKSDSASFDNMLEFLVICGRSLPQSLMMLIPEAWNGKNPISDELKAFYEYNACSMEPWDGPASIVFCDGRFVGGTLDRNGLRPSRYTITKSGILVMGSETGVQDFSAEEIECKGRLRPGKLLLVDLLAGRIIPDDEAKKHIACQMPYLEWVNKNVHLLPQEAAEDSCDADPLFTDDKKLLFLEKSFGYTREDRNRLLLPMLETGQEPTSSMGTDTPLAVFSQVPQRVFAYFKQLFAQVTNPPIDSIREDLVMSLTSFVGPSYNILEVGEKNCRRVKVKNPILTPADLERLKKIKPAAAALKTYVLEAVLKVNGESLETAINYLVQQALSAVEDGASLIVLSDRAAAVSDSGLCAIPSLCAVGSVHHALIKAGKRMCASIIVESAEPREIMHFALLFGYGADLVVPYGALACIAGICRSFDGKKINAAGGYRYAEHQYLKALTKAMLKVMSKMGTSTLRSYRGAQIFEAVGIGQAVIDKCFCGTASRIGGIGFAELEAEALARYRIAVASDAAIKNTAAGQDFLLSGEGQYRWRKNGEQHAWNPDVIHLLQYSTRTSDYAMFKKFTDACNTLNRSPHVIRGLLEFAESSPIPIEQVEPIEEIMKRFTTGAMSFGSISKEAHETIAYALNSIHGRSNSGEGGEDPSRFAVKPDGSWARSAIKQVASGRFGVSSEYLANCIEIQIKMAQGAKPGEGGQLPGHKVDVMIGKTRNSTPGVTLISPPPHHDIYSIEDLSELIFDLKNANPNARISVKLVSESGVGTVAAGVAKAHADNILISGYDGGTGASPQSSIRHAGLPFELGIAETHQTLVKNGLRGRVRLQTDGQIKTGRDIVIAGMLGAEEFGFGTSTLVVLGCVMMRKCHENTCPMGVATQDPVLRDRFTGKPEYLVNFFRFLAQEVREIMAELGFKTFNSLVGRADLLRQRQCDKPKCKNIDLSKMLYKAEGPSGIEGGTELCCVQNQIHKIDDVLDRVLIEKCSGSLEQKLPTTLQMDVHNTDRAVGAMLSYEVSKRFGGHGLPENFITVDWTGQAGQSFGAFLAKGITFRLSGDTNDYLGKGLSGGRLAVFPPAGAAYKSNENIIVGNTVLYGATSGELYAAGVAGERFCVRNSGALAVVEGAGDHCAEYMTGGRLVVLGPVGRNFAAGMSGGIAYVLDKQQDESGRPFEYYLNSSMVEVSRLDNLEDETFVHDSISKHVYWTGSAYAKSILDDWQQSRLNFYKILPVEYKRALNEMKIAELDQKLYDIRKREDLGEKS
ncbi:MAG: glutamate synthase large subunit [Termitinemataceae bacterium]|nr:MAG: glutamate synthase large subunit [Termitinemataceae bacterium]